MTVIIPEPSPEPGLRAELTAVEAEFPGWHCWTSDAGTVNAVHVLSRQELADIERWLPERDRGLRAAPAITLDAPSPQLIRYAIASYLEQPRRGWSA